MQLLTLGDRYNLLENRSWKLLRQIGGQALEERIEEIWADTEESLRNHAERTKQHDEGNSTSRYRRSTKNTLEMMPLTSKRTQWRMVLTYEGHGHKKAAERIYKINALLPLFGEDAKSFSDKEMARRIVPKLLKGRARVKYFNKDGHKLHKKKDVLKLCRGILKGLAIKNEVNAEQREHDKDRRFCNKDTNQDDDKGEVKDKFSKMKNPCRKHNK